MTVEPTQLARTWMEALIVLVILALMAMAQLALVSEQYYPTFMHALTNNTSPQQIVHVSSKRARVK